MYARSLRSASRYSTIAASTLASHASAWRAVKLSAVVVVGRVPLILKFLEGVGERSRAYRELVAVALKFPSGSPVVETAVNARPRSYG